MVKMHNKQQQNSNRPRLTTSFPGQSG